MRRILWIMLAAIAPLAAQPRVANAKLETRAINGNLEGTFRGLAAQPGPVWIGYAVPAIAGDRGMCCWEGGMRCGCALEGASSGMVRSSTAPLKLEGGDIAVLFRAAGGHVSKIRTFSMDCELDAGGLPFHWLTGVRPVASIALLTPLVGGATMDGALAAIAMHADPAADHALDGFVSPDRPERLREKGPFWLGAARGRHGYETLRRMVRDDPSESVREKSVFALSVSSEPEAVDAILDAAHNDKSGHVRGQALFWLGQKAGKKAAAAIAGAIENDPETGVKRHAVFALSQLPKDEGIPLLIQVARTNRNPEVRKQAMFWLGQSHDARALQFFEDVLKH